MKKKKVEIKKTPDVEYWEGEIVNEKKKNPIKLAGIQLKAEAILRKKDSDRLVGKYVDLLEIIKLKKKELASLDRAKKKYEINPEAYCDQEDGLW